MAKSDKSHLSKEERRRIKAQRKLEKSATEQQIILSDPEPTPVQSDGVKNYILCLKHGAKYNHEYVNKLYNMVKNNCTIDYEFVCLTDNPRDLHPDVKTLPLPGDLEGWWCKPYMFSADLPIKGNILYIDLDVVIAGNIDKLFTFEPEHWCTVRDFTRAMRPKWQKYNSSVVRFKTGELDHVWKDFYQNRKNIQRRFFGDQDWLYEATRKRPAMLYPDAWIMSWKWEIRKTKDWAPGGRKGNRTFKNIENVTPRPDCCITVFHGDPNPHTCQDPWVVKNWK